MNATIDQQHYYALRFTRKYNFGITGIHDPQKYVQIMYLLNNNISFILLHDYNIAVK